MSASPYRAPDQPDESDVPAARSGTEDAELVPVFAALWVASLTFAVVHLIEDSAVGAEAALAWVAVVALPLLLKDGLHGILKSGIKKS